MNWNFNCLPRNITTKDKASDLQLFDNIKKSVPEDATWIVQEKVQGVGVGISYNKENGFNFCVRPNEYENLLYIFHLADKAVFKIKDKVKKLFKKSGAKKEIIVYGKIVPSKGDFDDFYAFSLFVDDEIQNISHYIGLFEECNLLFAKMLLIAPLKECLKFSLDTDSQITHWQNPSSEKKTFMHGVIIQPKDTTYDKDGWRVVLKKQRS